MISIIDTLELSDYTSEEIELIELFKDNKDIKWKPCKKCKKNFPVDIIFYYKEKRISDGFENSCRKCRTGRFLSKEYIDDPERYKLRIKDRLNLTKGFFNNKKDIIKYYEHYLETDIIPYNDFITDFFKVIIKYLIDEKYRLSDELILNLRRDWIKKHKLYGYYLRNYNGSIVQMINDIFPNRFKAWEFMTAGKRYWNNEDNINNALDWFMRQLKKDKVVNNLEDIPKKINGDIFKKYKLSGLLIKFKGHPYYVFEYLYPGKFYAWDYASVPHSFYNNKQNRIKFFKQLINQIGIKIDDIPKILSYEYLHLNKYRKFQHMINEYYSFDINKLIKECWSKQYNTFDLPYRNHYLTLDDIIVRSEPERMIHHTLIHNFNNVEYEPKKFYDKILDNNYLPDWIIKYKGKNIIVEYYGMLEMTNVDWNYSKKYEDKDIYYKELCKNNKKYIYLPLYVDDIKNNMKGLIDKFKELKVDIDIPKYYK